MQAIELTKISDGKIDAVDIHRPFLDNLRRSVEEEGIPNRIRIVNSDKGFLSIC